MSFPSGLWLARHVASCEQRRRDGSGRALVARSHAPAAEPALVHYVYLLAPTANPDQNCQTVIVCFPAPREGRSPVDRDERAAPA